MNEVTVVRDADCTADMQLLFGHQREPIYGNGFTIKPRIPGKQETDYDRKIYLPELLPLEEYDKIIVLYSGGKDSTACYYLLREMGVPKEKIELWHHDIDGGHPFRRMDWPVTQAYVEAFAEAEQVYLRKSCRINGFWGEVYRVGSSYPIEYDDDDGDKQICKLSKKQKESQELRGKLLQEIDPEAYEALQEYGYRMKFPAKCADLSRRWCSAALKIDVASSVLCNLKELGCVLKFPAKGSIGNGRFCPPELKRGVGDSVLRNLDTLQKIGKRGKLPAKSGCHQGRWCSGNLKAAVEDSVTSNLEEMHENTKILVVSGERRGESSGRAKYNEMEIHRTNATAKAHRLVHQWRLCIDLTLKDVWEVNRRYRVVPHPCYRCGWNRCSCMMCIFSLPKHWAGIRELFPEEFEAVCRDEEILGFTLDNKRSLREFVGDAESCVVHDNSEALRQLITGEFSAKDIFCDDWTYPPCAFGGAEGGPC